MNENESDELASEHLAAVKKFRIAVQDILKKDDDDEYLLRWLRARDFDLAKSEAMLRKSMKFMYNIEAEDLLHSGYELPEVIKYMPTCFCGFDKEGSPVRLLATGLLDMKGYARAFSIIDTVKFLKYFVESDTALARENAKKNNLKLNPQAVYIFDYSGLKMMQIFDKLLLQKSLVVTTMYQDNFPELLKVIFLINAPSFFMRVINIFKPFINQRTWKKVRIFSTDAWKDEILEFVDPAVIPKHLGGFLNDKTCDPTDFYERTNGGTIPVECYLKDDSYLNAKDPSVKLLVVPERNFLTQVVNIGSRDLTIRWLLHPKDNTIKFGLYYSNSESKKTQLVEITPPKMIESIIPERGEYFCGDNLGQYILKFDNSFSWILKKQVLLKLEVVGPSKSII